MNFWLSHDRCPIHHYEAISLNTSDDGENQGGLRLTRGKCCGRWESLKRWKIDPWQLAVDVLGEARGLTQDQRFYLAEMLPDKIPYRDEEFVVPSPKVAPRSSNDARGK